MINLIPTDLKEARLYGRRNRTIVGYTVGIATIGVLAMAVLYVNMYFVKDDEARLRQEMNQRQDEALKLENSQKEVDKIAGQLKTIDKLYSGEVKFSELIPRIGALMPNGAIMNALTLTGGKSNPLQLDVDIDDPKLAAVLQQNLVNSDLFEAVDISSIISKGVGTAKPGQRTYAYGATLTASFKGNVIVKKTTTQQPEGAQ